MKCKKAQQAIDLYLDGILSNKKSCELFTHINTCHRCSQFYNARRALRKLIDELPRLEPPVDFISKVERKINAQKIKPIQYKERGRSQWWSIAAVLFIALSFSLLFVLTYHKTMLNSTSRVCQIKYNIEPQVIKVPIPVEEQTTSTKNTIQFLSKDYSTGGDVVVQMPASVSLNNYSNMENYYLENVSY